MHAPSRAAIAAASALAALALATTTGCPRRAGDPGAAATVPDGLAVAIYVGGAPGAERRALALVDDRRTNEIGADGQLALGDVAAGIDLASLIVESLDPATPLRVASCTRQGSTDGAALAHRVVRIVTVEGAEVEGRLRHVSWREPGRGQWVLEDEAGAVHFVSGELERARIADTAALEVRCAVRAAPGRHRVRIAYATTDLSWSAAYEIDVAAPSADGAPGAPGAAAAPRADATVQPTFTIAGSGLLGARRATVQLLVGLPGGDATPRLAWSGDVDLGADAVAVQPPARALPLALHHVYRGAVSLPDENPRHGAWHAQGSFDVWLALGVDDAAAATLHDLPAGPALVDVARDGQRRQVRAEWPAPASDKATAFDVALWPDGDVLGYRDRRQPRDDGAVLVEQLLYTVSNHGRAPITVWVEEELRPGAARRTLKRQWPVKGERRGRFVRFPVRVKPGGTERLGFEAEYQW